MYGLIFFVMIREFIFMFLNYVYVFDGEIKFVMLLRMQLGID